MASTPASSETAIVFGPVPSRRLGRSLGVNNIPPKTCSYACVYCQLGRTTRMKVERVACYRPQKILSAVSDRLEAAAQIDEPIDYITFVPDGEPTLDLHLEGAMERLRPLGCRIAVISNASLLFHREVRQALCGADWVSVKVDAAEEAVWRKIDRPHKALRFDRILDGLLEFAAVYDGHLVTETMLVKGVNDDQAHLERIAELLGRIRPAEACVAAPIRPPAEHWVEVPPMGTMLRAHQILSKAVDQVEFLIGYEGNAFARSGSVEESLLSITAVHPMREEAVDELLEGTGEGWETVERLLSQEKLVRLVHEGHTFYVRRLPGR